MKPYTPFTYLARARYDRGMRRPRSRAWYLAIARRLDHAAEAYFRGDDMGKAIACHDRATDARYFADGAF